MGQVEKDISRIKYSKKHNHVLKKLHTTDGLRLANPDAFAELQKIDPEGEMWKSSDYEDVFGNAWEIALNILNQGILIFLLFVYGHLKENF